MISVSCFEVGFCESNVCFRGVQPWPLLQTLQNHTHTSCILRITYLSGLVDSSGLVRKDH